MEEKKMDVNSIIGFVLIFGILIFMFYQNRPTPEEIAEKEAQQEQVEAQEAAAELETVAPVQNETPVLDVTDSTAVASYKSQIGAFGFTAPTAGTTRGHHQHHRNVPRQGRSATRCPAVRHVVRSVGPDLHDTASRHQPRRQGADPGPSGLFHRPHAA